MSSESKSICNVDSEAVTLSKIYSSNDSKAPLLKSEVIDQAKVPDPDPMIVNIHIAPKAKQTIPKSLVTKCLRIPTTHKHHCPFRDDILPIQKASNKEYQDWIIFLEKLNKFIKSKIKSDISKTNTDIIAAPAGWEIFFHEDPWLAKFSNNNKSNYGINISKLSVEAGLPKTASYERGLFEALVKRNYAHKMIVGLDEANRSSEAIPYLAYLIKTDGLIEMVDAAPVASSGQIPKIDLILKTNLENPIIQEALIESVKNNQDPEAALILADQMLKANPGDTWTDEDRERVIKLQRIIESSEILMAYDPLKVSIPIVIEDILASDTSIFSKLRLITGKSFFKSYSRVGLDLPDDLFTSHRNLTNIPDSQLKTLAEYAMLVKPNDPNELHRGQVEYISSILSNHPNKAKYDHIVANLQYETKKDMSPAERLQAELTDFNVQEINGYSQVIDLGDGISIQQIPTTDSRSLLISSPSGYIELDSHFLQDIQSIAQRLEDANDFSRSIILHRDVIDRLETRSQKPQDASPNLDQYIKAIKLLANVNHNPLTETAEQANQELAHKAALLIGTNQHLEFIRSRLGGNQCLFCQAF